MVLPIVLCYSAGYAAACTQSVEPASYHSDPHRKWSAPPPFSARPL